MSRACALLYCYIIILIGVNTWSHEQPCNEFLQELGNRQYHRYLTNQGRCLLGIHSLNTPDLIYRDFVVSDDGGFMVFNSYGSGPESETTAARLFYFFPRGGEPSVLVQREQVQVFTGTPNMSFSFHKETGRLLRFSHGRVEESDNVNSQNQGGVEIQMKTGFYLDVGFAMGRDPSSIPSAGSKFINFKGQICKVQNHEIFEETALADVKFRFNDFELSQFLQKRCPEFQITL